MSSKHQKQLRGIRRQLARRKLPGLAGASALALVLVACGSSQTTTTGSTVGSKAGNPAAPLKGKTIAYIQTGPIPYYEYTKQGVGKAGELLGADGVKTYNSGFAPDKEIANVRTAITEGVDGLILEPIAAGTTKGELRLAKRAGIPVVLLYGYTEAVKDDAAGFQQTRYADTGCAAGEQMRKLLPSGSVAVITGTAGRGDAEGFTGGFEDCLGDKKRVVAVMDGNYDRQKASDVARDLVTKYPNLKGLFVHNEDMSLGVISALGPKAKNVTIVTQNGSPDGLVAVAAGKIKATVGWSPSAEGAMATRLLAEAMSGRGPSSRVCLTPFAIDTPEEPEKSAPWAVTTANIQKALKTDCASPGSEG
jgi:ribose transport system substrate-binding protein